MLSVAKLVIGVRHHQHASSLCHPATGSLDALAV
jgi:hypothetical protein